MCPLVGNMHTSRLLDFLPQEMSVEQTEKESHDISFPK